MSFGNLTVSGTLTGGDLLSIPVSGAFFLIVTP
jgi:hypothetical protein